MSGRRVFVRDRLGNRGDSFKVVINKKSDSEESMEDGQLSEDNAESGWEASNTRARVMSRAVMPDILSEVCVDDRRVVETEDMGRKRREPVVTRVPIGRPAERKRRVGWGDPYDVKSKKNRVFSNFKQSIQDIVRDNDRGKEENRPIEKVKTFTDRSQKDAFGWERKLKGPRMGMVADMVEERVSAKDRLHNNDKKEMIIKRKVPNKKIERSIQLDVKPNQDIGRNIVMTEVVEEEEEEEFANIVRTVHVADDDIKKTGSRFAGRLGPSFGSEDCVNTDNGDVMQKLKKMEEKIQRRREVRDNLEHDNGEDLPEWDETVVIKVPQDELDIDRRNERRRQVKEELEIIEAAKQRDEIRRKKERRIEEMKINEKLKKEQELRRKEDLKIKQAEEELRRQEELIQTQMQIIERQKEIEKEKQDLEMMREIKERENQAKKKQHENEDRVKEEIRIVKEKEKRLIQEKKYKERKKAEKLREERRREDKRRTDTKNDSKDAEKEKKSRKRYSSDEDSSSESEESDSESSSSSESETDSSETDSDDSEYEQKRRKNKSKVSPSKKERMLKKEKDARKAKDKKPVEEIKSNKKDTKATNPPKPKEEPRSETNKDNPKEERKQTNEEVKKTAELKDKLKSYLSRAKEAKENKKK